MSWEWEQVWFNQRSVSAYLLSRAKRDLLGYTASTLRANNVSIPWDALTYTWHRFNATHISEWQSIWIEWERHTHSGRLFHKWPLVFLPSSDLPKIHSLALNLKRRPNLFPPLVHMAMEVSFKYPSTVNVFFSVCVGTHGVYTCITHKLLKKHSLS